MATTQQSCPECSSSGQVDYTEYQRDAIRPEDLVKEDAYEAGLLNVDYTVKVAARAVKCRVCFGTGFL